MHFTHNTNDMSTTAFDTPPTMMITNHNNNNNSEQCTTVLLNSNERTAMKTTNVNDGRQNQRDREKGEREKREDYVKRTRQTNQNTDSVTSFANKQYNCSSINSSMANYFSSSFERNNIFLSNNHSTTRQCREYQPSYPSITRFQTALSSSPYRKTHYLDDSDEEIIKDEIIEIIDLDHYPTLIERWGEDTKVVIRQQGEFKIEDYVEFEEIEPTIIEEISYEFTYEGGQIKSTREIHHSRSESRNFRKIKKRRTKRKRTKPLLPQNTSLSQPNDSSFQNTFINRTYETLPSIINGIRSANIDLIDDDISSQIFQEENLFELIEQDRNQSHISSNDISSRTKSSINESNDKQTKISVKQEETEDEQNSSSIIIDTDSDEQQSSPSENSELIRFEDTTASIDHRSLETTAAHDILTTTLPLDLPSIDIETETVEQNAEKSLIHSVVETIPLRVPSNTNDTPVQYTHEDEKHSVSINKSEPAPTAEEATAPSDLLSTEIVYTEKPNDEKSSNYFTTEVDKQPEAIITPITNITTTTEKELSQQTYSSRSQFLTSNSVDQTTDTILFDKQQQQQSSIPLKTEEDEDVALSSDFLANIVHQITTTSATTHLSSIDHTEQFLENLTEDSPTIIAEQPNIEDNEQSESISDSAIAELTNSSNSIVTIPSEISSEKCIDTPQQLETITQISSPNLVSLETSIPSETDFSDLYPDHYFSSTTNEQTFSNLTSMEDEQLEGKDAISDLTKIYYELREQRHIQPVLDNALTNQKQETSDINLDNQNGHFNIKSFPIITNLPTREYRRIFGVSNEIIDTVNDLIYDVDQKVQSNISNEESQVKETFEDHQSIIPAEQKELANEITPSITSNLELDLRYSLLLDRMNTLLKPLMNSSSSSSSFITKTKSIPSNTEEEQDSSSIIDQVTTSFTGVPANITSDSSLVTPNEQIATNNNTDLSNEKEISTTVDQITSTTQSVTDNNEILTLPEANSEAIVSKSSEDDEKEQEAHQTRLSSSISFEEHTASTDAKVQSPIVIDEIKVISKSNEEIEKEEVDNQQQSSSTGLFEIVKNLFPSTLQPNTPIETSLESVQSKQQDIVENPIDNFNLSNINTNQQTSLQASTTDEKESHGVFDLNVSAISSFGSSNETSTVIDNIAEEVNHNTDEKIVSTQEQVAEIPRQSINSNYPWYSGRYDVAETEFDRLSSTHQSSTIDHKQEDENEKKPSYQPLQVINDDYPWYSSYYSIVDAEAKFARLYKPLNLSNEQSLSLIKVEFQNGITQKNELQDEQDTDGNDFHIVQHRKRIPSSTTHEKTVPSTIITNELVLSPDIDLEPVILHGHPSESLPISPIVPQTTDTTPKKKQKKKKKDKKETILFDAPEPTVDLVHSETVQEEQDSSSIIDQVTTSFTGVPANITSDSSLVTPNKEINTTNNTDLSNEKEISTTVDQITSTTQSVTDNNDILTLPEANSEAIVSKSSEDDEKEQGAHQTGLSSSISFEEHTTSADAEVQSPIVIDEIKVISKSNEEIEKEEVDNQQQSSSTGLFEIVKNLLPLTLQPNISIETSLESVQSEQQDIVENPIDNFNLSSTLQVSTTDEKESHGVFDLVVSAISNLGSSDETSAVIDNIVEEVNRNTDEQVISTQEQVAEIPRQSINSNYPWYSGRYDVAETEFDRLSSTHQSVTIDYKQEDENEKKPSYQPLQVTNDDYPWYSSYYSIADAEAKFARLYKPLNLSDEQSLSLIKVEFQNGITQKNELQDEQDTDGNDFHIVQHRKRIPSSTTHEKTVPSTIITNEPVLSPDIDLEPVILHGHSSESLPISPIVPQTTDTTSKKKQKKKKKDKKEMILFDAPEPTVDVVHSKTVQEEQDSSSIIDQVRTIVTDAPANITSDSSLVTPNEEINTANDTDLSNEKEIPTTVDQITSTTQSVTDNNDILTLPEANREAIVSKSSEGNTTKAEDDEQKQVAHETRLSPSKGFEEHTASADAEVQSSIVIDEIKVISKSNEEIEKEEVDNQQQSSSTGLFEIVKNPFPSTLQPNTHIETSLEIFQSEQQDIVENLVDNFNLSSTDMNQQTSLQASTTDEKESHGVFDLVVSAISNLSSSDETSAVIDNTVEEVNHNTDEKIVSTQEQVAEIPRQSRNSNYPWYSGQYKVAETEFDRLSSSYQSATIDHKQEDENEKKPSYQPLQVTNDDYPWYSSYYSIADAEAKFARLYKPLNLSNEQSLSLTKVEFQNGITQKNELQDEQATDDNSFHIVQHRKRIPSSTIHEKTVPSTIITNELVLSPDIDLEPVILHGHPSESLPISPIVPQTTDITPKKKQKKKKKDKKEMILFDAPEPTVDLVHSETVQEQQGQNNIEMNDTVTIDQTLKHEEEQLHPISTVISDDQRLDIVSTSIMSDAEELTQIGDKKNELTSSDTSFLLSTPVATLPEDVQITTQLIEQQPTEEESIILTSPPSSIEPIRKTIQTNITPSPKKEEEDEEDNEGFQLVRYRGRILSNTKADQTSLSTPISNEIISPDLDQKKSIPDKHQSSSTPKKKRNKHKKQKKEVDSSSKIDSSKIEQEPVDQEAILQSPVTSSPALEDSNVQTHPTLPSIITTTKIHLKPSASSEEEDNEGFQVVIYRKRITSAPRFTNNPPSPLTKTRYERNVNRNIDHRRVVLHERHGSASPSIPRTTVITKTPSKQTSLFHTPPRSVSAETQIITSNRASDSFRTPKEIKQKIEQAPVERQQRVKDPKREPTLDLKSKLDQSSPKEPTVEQIVEEHHTSTNEEIKTTDQQSSVEETVPSTPSNTSNIEAEKSTPIKAKIDSPPSTTTPESVIPQVTTQKKKPKKSKTNKDDMRLPLTTNRDSIPLSVEETTDRKANDDIQQAPEPQIAPADDSSNSEAAPLINTASETITSPIIEQVSQTNDAQSPLQSIQSIASSTNAVEEVSKASNGLPDKIDDPSITNPTKEILPITNTEDEQVQTTSSKKPAKRRKKKLHIKDKSDDENVFNSSAAATSLQIEPTIPPLNDVQQESNVIETTTISSFNSLSNTSEILSNDVNNKLDLFLPAYILQQINTPQTSPSSSSISPINSFNTMQKKKPRSKMLNKDPEAKRLLTNEFDNTLHTEKQVVQQITSLDDEHIDDDDEFIVQSIYSFPPTKSLNNSTEKNVDNILSHGFYLWLQESQAISQQQQHTRTPIMQSIVIRPVTTTDEDESEDSWNAVKAINSTYMIGIHPKKQIHMANAYSINHPESISTPSWLTGQSNKKTFQDKPEKFDSDNEDDSFHDEPKKQADTQSNSNNYQPITYNKLGKDFSHQNPSINFDDWAHFSEDKTSYHIGHDLSTSLECFYTRTLDEDTLLSDAIPIDHSINNKQQRYGDFLPSNSDELTIKRPLRKTKPSEYFQNYPKQDFISKKQHQNDDEILISHSIDGLSRRVRL